MTRLEFIQNFKKQTSDAATFGTIANLEKPTGREPSAKDIDLSNWYCTLTEGDRAVVREIIREAAQLATFNALCLLDGVSAVANGIEEGELELRYVKPGENILLNGPSDELLHDGYNALCRSSEPAILASPSGRAYEVGQIDHLRRKQIPGDGLDIHAIPSGSEVAIALPKHEHRKL